MAGSRSSRTDGAPERTQSVDQRLDHPRAGERLAHAAIRPLGREAFEPPTRIDERKDHGAAGHARAAVHRGAQDILDRPRAARGERERRLGERPAASMRGAGRARLHGREAEPREDALVE